MSRHTISGQGRQALRIYDEMRKCEGNLSSEAVVAALKACRSLQDLGSGRKIHGHIAQSGMDTNVAAALVRLYAKCGSLLDARLVFEKIDHDVPNKDVVTSNALIAGYAHQGQSTPVFRLFEKIRQQSIQPDSTALLSVLIVCNHLGLVDKGQQCFECTTTEYDTIPIRDDYTCMIDLLGRAGLVDQAMMMLRSMPFQPVQCGIQYLVFAESGAMWSLEGRRLNVRRGDADHSIAGISVQTLGYGGRLRRLQEPVVVDSRRLMSTFVGRSFLGSHIPDELVLKWSTKGLTDWNICQLHHKCPNLGPMGRKAMQVRIWQTPVWAVEVLKTEMSSKRLHGDRLCCRAGNVVYTHPLPKDEFSWTALISRHVKSGKGRQALTIYKEMREEGIRPSSYTFIAVLKACRSLQDLETAKRIQCEVVKSGFESDVFVENMLLDVYAKCGSLVDARHLFEKMRKRNVISWNAMILGYAQRERGEVSLQLYARMQHEGVVPNDRTFVGVLKACSSLAAFEGENEAHKILVTNRRLAEVRVIHSQVMQSQFESDVFVATTLVDLYAKCGSMVDARQVFEQMPKRNAVAWTAMILGYAETTQGEIGLQLYARMKLEGVAADARVFVGALKACISVGAMKGHHSGDAILARRRCLEHVRAIHSDVRKGKFESDVFVGNMLVDVYAKCGSLVDARTVFDRMPQRNVISWNTMISGYANIGEGEVGLQMYAMMQKEGVVPSDRTFVGALKACASLAALKEWSPADGILVTKQRLKQLKVIHSHIVKSGIKFDVFLGTTLVDLYAKCGSMVDARLVFEKMPHRNVASWTTMILGYAQMEDGEVALQLYKEMRNQGLVPDARALVGALKACSNLAAFEQGENDDEILHKSQCLEQVRVIHAEVVKGEMETDIFVANMLVDVYAKCGSLVEGRHVFEKMPNRDVISWSTMILGYAQMEEGEVALQLYTRMQQDGVVPNDRTFVGALKACSVVAGLEMGRKIHAQILKTPRGANDLYMASSLIDMYGKCGSMVDAQQVFDALPTPDTVTWNVLIAGYARQGESGLVFNLFEQMKERGTQPEVSTFVSILRVCSSAGLLSEGQEYFEAMSKDFGITPTMDHYACVVDLLARAGQVDKAMAMVNSMPYEPDSVLWKTVLGACQTRCNVELGRQAFECAIKLDQSDAAAYVLMSNIYAAAQMWEAAQQIRTQKATLGAWKQPGQSWWTDFCGTVHVFLVGDAEHSESQHIHSQLRNLNLRMEDECIHPLYSVAGDRPDDS